MKSFFLLSIFLILFNSFNLKLEENINEITLSEEIVTRRHYNIKTNEKYIIKSSSDKYIYFLELLNDIEVQDANNQIYKKLACIASSNDSLIINPKEETGKEIYFEVTSISNDEVEAKIENRANFHLLSLLDKNLINIIYTKQDEIITLNSLENSIAFSYWKYEYSKDSNPSNIYPINRKLFTRYNESIIMTLETDSIYIFIAEKYKIYSPINSIDIFVSPLEVDKNINLEYDVIYLKAADNYKISFQQTKLSRILKLSKKTNNSIITLNGETILNSDKFYYELKPESNDIQLNVANADALIEILFSSNDDSEVLNEYSIEKYKLTKKYTIIKIPKIKSTYDFQISSENKKKLNAFDFGYNHKISKDKYFYNWLEFSQAYDEKGLLITSPYLYRTETDKEEYQIFEIVLNKDQLDNDIYLTYNPSSFYQYLYKPIDEKTSEYIIGNISSILKKFYIYKDIAKIPPQFENLPNYHHKPIDLFKSLKEIKTINRTHLGLYQDINQVLTAIRDQHLHIVLANIENELDLSSVMFCSPFDLFIENIANVAVIKMRAFNQCLNIIPQYKDKIIKMIFLLNI